MKLLYTLTAYPPSTGGAQLHQHLLARYLSDRHCIQVVTHWTENRTDWLLGTTLRATDKPSDYQIDGIAVHQLALQPREKWLLAPFVLTYYPLMGIALPRIAAPVERQLQPYAAKADLIHNVRIGREGLSLASLQA